MTATYTVNCSILLTDLPLLDRPGAARNAGFEAVEFWWPFETPKPPDAEVAAFIRAIQDSTSPPVTCPQAIAGFCPIPP
jgi:hydroxypyruvate isomerase